MDINGSDDQRKKGVAGYKHPPRKPFKPVKTFIGSMARRRGPSPSVRVMNQTLIKLGLKKQGKPLSTRPDRGPSIPQMHPNIRNSSAHQRVGNPIVKKVQGTKKVTELVGTGRFEIKPVYTSTGLFTGHANVEQKVPVTKTVPVGNVTDVKLHYNVRKLSKKRGGGFGGGKKPAVAIEGKAKRRGKGHNVKTGVTRGGRPGREAKKKKKE